MSESNETSRCPYSSSQLESLEILTALNNSDILEIPHDNGKYTAYGNLIQTGRIVLGTGQLERIAKTDLNYLPPPKAKWEKSIGATSEIFVPAGGRYVEEIPLQAEGEFQLKTKFPLTQGVEVKLLSGKKEIAARVEKFLTVLIVSYCLPKSFLRAPINVVINNLSGEDLVFAGVGKRLKIRFIPKTEAGQKTFVRKLNRATSLIKNGEFKALFRAVYYNFMGKIHIIRRKLLLVFPLIFLNSCVLPPDSSGPRVFSSNELNFIADSQKAIAYSQSGRFDQAEFNFRKALAVTKAPPTLLLANLGFVLRSQGKFSDALTTLKLALVKEPYFLHARVNLGRTYFEMGDIDSSIAEYLTAERDYFDFWGGAPDRRLSYGFSNHELLSVYSDLSIMFAQKGMIAESICYSQKALDLGDKDYKPQAHARFLLSLEQFYLSGEILRQIVFTGSQITAPLPASLTTSLADGTTPKVESTAEEDPSSILDLGVVRLLEENLPLAGEAFDRVLTLTIVPNDVRLLTKLLRYEVATAQNDSETSDLLNLSFSEVTEGLCLSSSYATPPYWPIRLRDRILERRKQICRTYG